MDKNSMAIIVLCSHLCTGENIKPFEPSEWTKFADMLIYKNIQPFEVLSFNNADLKQLYPNEAERITNLIGRSASIAFEVERYASMGIKIMTRADHFYPKVLKKKLGKLCPPLFYYVGNPAIADSKCMGFVGSRSVEKEDEQFTKSIIETISQKNMTIVSGGARGIDSIAQELAFDNGLRCIEYASDSLAKKIKNKNIIKAIHEDKLLILSVSKPDAGFSIGIAMMRNKYIYSQSEDTVVVKSDYNKGGTWSGAIENIRHKRSNTYCWYNPEYKGNMELISRGAIPIDESLRVVLDVPVQMSLLECEQ